MIDLVNMLFELLDPALLFWALVLNVLGYHLKKVGLPKYCPPIPLLLYLVALVPCLALGWATVNAEGGKAAYLAIFYGLSNAGLITLPAIFGYDVVHAFTGKYAKDCKYKFVLRDSSGIADELKGIVYGSTFGVVAVASGSLAYFVFGENVLYALCWALLFGGFATVAARTILHAVKKDNSAEMYAISIYALMALGGWLGLILTGSWLWVSVFGALVVGSTLMALGTRYLDPVEDDVKKDEKTEEEVEEVKIETPDQKLAFLKETVRFKFDGDSLDGAPLLNYPICKVDGDALTVKEADEKGYGAIAADGLEYLKDILEKEGL